MLPGGNPNQFNPAGICLQTGSAAFPRRWHHPARGLRKHGGVCSHTRARTHTPLPRAASQGDFERFLVPKATFSSSSACWRGWAAGTMAERCAGALCLHPAARPQAGRSCSSSVCRDHKEQMLVWEGPRGMYKVSSVSPSAPAGWWGCSRVPHKAVYSPGSASPSLTSLGSLS